MLRRFAHQHRSVHQPVLGTVLDLQLRTSSARAARRAEAAVLAEFDRLLDVLSAFDPESELSRWRRAPGVALDALSPELRTLLHGAAEWQAVLPRVQIRRLTSSRRHHHHRHRRTTTRRTMTMTMAS